MAEPYLGWKVWWDDGNGVIQTAVQTCTSGHWDEVAPNGIQAIAFFKSETYVVNGVTYNYTDRHYRKSYYWRFQQSPTDIVYASGSGFEIPIAPGVNVKNGYRIADDVFTAILNQADSDMAWPPAP